MLYCARHRFGTDAMDGTSNIVAVMDAMGHSKMDVTRLYQHPGLKEIRNAINKRNEVVQRAQNRAHCKNSGFQKRALSD